MRRAKGRLAKIRSGSRVRVPVPFPEQVVTVGRNGAIVSSHSALWTTKVYERRARSADGEPFYRLVYLKEGHNTWGQKETPPMRERAKSFAREYCLGMPMMSNRQRQIRGPKPVDLVEFGPLAEELWESLRVRPGEANERARTIRGTRRLSKEDELAVRRVEMEQVLN